MSSFFEWERSRHGVPPDPATQGHFVESQWEIHPEDIVVDERHKLGAGQFGKHSEVKITMRPNMIAQVPSLEED